MVNAPLQVVWFKRDLRLSDHKPLLEASRRGPVLCLYLLELELYTAPDFAPRQLEFAWSCLQEMHSSLQALGTALTVLEGEAVEVLERIRQRCGVAGLWAHQETGNALSYARDRRVRRWARETGVPFTEVVQSGVVRRLGTRDGWHERWLEFVRQPVLAAPVRLEGVSLKSGSRSVCPTLSFELLRSRLGLNLDPCELQSGGRRAALDRLGSFLGARGVDYTRAMSSPLLAQDACSRLSPHLAYGTLSVRETYGRAQAFKRTLHLNIEHGEQGEKVDPRWFAALASLVSRLEWRDHFTQKLEDESALEFKAVHPAFNTLRDDLDATLSVQRLQAFKAGQTGFPLVDACIRSLVATGWLNFRMRAMLVSFAAYHLGLDWRPVGHFLARAFTDYEPGIHWPQMQMQSGVTGINTLRIYNPAKQAREHDPQGTFMRCWLPELAQVPLEYLPEPHAMPPLTRLMSGMLQERYPAPIVNEKKVLEAAKNRIYALRALESTRLESARVIAKHASRKPPRARMKR